MAEPAAPDESLAPSHTGGLAIAAAIVAFGFLGSRLLGILRTTVIAWRFGSGPELDAYNVAFRVPDLIFQVLAGATLGSAFIPVFTRLYRRESQARAWELASSVLNLVTLATAVLCALALLLAPVIVPLTAPGLDPAAEDKAVSLTRLMLLSPLLFSMSGIVTGILNARQRFLLPALAPMLYNLAIIFGAVVLAKPWGIEGLATGVVLGAAAHLAVQMPGLARERMAYRFLLGWKDAAVREVGRLMGPRVIGLAAAQLNFVIATYFASKMGAGAISALMYAWTISTLPLALFGMALSTAVFPRLAEQAADGDYEALAATVSNGFRMVLFLTVPAAAGLLFLRDPATTLLLRWGEFTAGDASLVAAALAFYCAGIVPQAAIEIHSRGFYALGDTRTPVGLAIVAMGFNLGLSALLWERFGLEGLAFAFAAAAWIEWASLYYLYLRRTGAAGAGDMDAFARIAFSGACMALFLAPATWWYDRGDRADSAIVAIAGSLAGAAFYAGMASLLRLPELTSLWARLPQSPAREE
ncbi:murein biosynthesis integral membrane protein MurJ [bacterium]|nr:MAG: murein biosynthesis integral membrane protein MurJ [bacterium]MCL4232108.1 murein biosynthesis integral membrane protein MurJ [Dehalococcoidia bacterium]